MEDRSSGSSGMRFLSFANDKEDKEKEKKLKEAALRIEEAIERHKSVSELVDYKPAPEADIDLANDSRPLYERLLEQRNKKQEALEESQKLSNLVTKLDEDEANYLNEIAKSKREEEIKKRLEVYDILEERKRINERKIIEQEKKLKESFLATKLQSNTTTSSTNNKSKSRLSSIIKVKPKPRSLADLMVDKMQKPPDGLTGSDSPDHRAEKRQSEHFLCVKHAATEGNQSTSSEDQPDPKRLKTHKNDYRDLAEANVDRRGCTCVVQNDVMRCIGVLPSLPLMDKIDDSSDSDNSNDDLSHKILPKIRNRNK